MWLEIGLILLYAGSVWAAFTLLLGIERQFSQSVLHKDYVTNGAVVFNAAIALVPLIGLAVAIAMKFTMSYGPSAKNWASRKSEWFN